MRAMVDLALNYGREPVLLKDIARRQEISLKYLDQIVSALRIRGLVRTAKKRHGGYLLSKPPSKIKALEVMEALEGSLAPVECVEDPAICHRSEMCVTINLWKKLQDSMRAVLEDVTLDDLAMEHVEIAEKRQKHGTYDI